MLPLTLIKCLNNSLSQQALPLVLAALRYDHLIWSSLHTPAFLERLCRRKDSNSACELNDWTPTILSLIALNQPVNTPVSIETIDPELIQQVTSSYPGLIQTPEDVDLARAGAIALAHADRYSKTGSWLFLCNEIDQLPGFPWATSIACLYGWAPDPLEMLQELTARQPSRARTELAIHAVLCHPADIPTQVKTLLAITKSSSNGLCGQPLDHLEFVKVLNDRNPELSSRYCQEVIAQQATYVFQPEAMPFHQIDLLRETEDILFTLEVVRLAGETSGQAKYLEKLSATQNLFSASVQAQVATLLTPNPSDALEASHLVAAWRQALELVQSSHPAAVTNSFKSGLAMAMAHMGNAGEALVLIAPDSSDLPDDPYQLIVLIQAATQAGNATLAKHAGSRLAEIFPFIKQSHSYTAAPASISPIKIADCLHMLGMQAEAMHVLEHALQQAPNQEILLDSLADVQQDLQLYPQAASTLQILAALHPDNLLLQRRLAKAYQLSQEWQAAVDVWTSLITDSHYPEPSAELDDLHALADSAIHAGLPVSAVHASQRALSLNADDGLAYTYLGRASVIQGDTNTGLDYLTQATRITPSQPECWLALANHLSYQGQFDQAVESLKTAIQGIPNDHRLLFALGELYRKTSNPTLAASSLRQAVSLEPGDANLHHVLGLAYYQSGQFFEAIREFEIAYSQQPANCEYAHAYGAALLNQGDAAAAIHPLRVAIQSRSIPMPGPYQDYARAVLDLIRQGVSSDAASSALEAVEYALTIEPEHPESKVIYAEALRFNGNLEAAFKAYSVALDTPLASDRRWREILSHGMAQVSLQLGRFDIAIASAQEATSAAPQNAENYKLLSDAYLASNLFEDSLRSARSVLNLNIDNIANLAWYADQITRLVADTGIMSSSVYQKQAQQAILEAHNSLLQAVQLLPYRADLLIKLSRLQQMTGEIDTALATLNLALNNDNATTEHLCEAAEQFYSLGDPKGMILCLKKAAAKEEEKPSHSSARVYQQLARAYADGEDLPAAVEIFQKAISLAPDKCNLYYERANLLIKLARFEDAFSCIETGISLSHPQPNLPTLYFLASWLYRQAGDVSSALGYIEKGLLIARNINPSGDPVTLPLQTSDRIIIADFYRCILQPMKAYHLLKTENRTPAPSTIGDDNDSLQLLALKTELEWELGYVPGIMISELSTSEQLKIPAGWLAILARRSYRNGDMDAANQYFNSAILATQEACADQAAQGAIERTAHNRIQFSLFETALELGKWQEAHQQLSYLAEFASNEPFTHLAYARLIVMQAEFQQACERLNVKNNAPGTEVLADNEKEALSQAIQQATHLVQVIEKSNQGYDLSFPVTRLERWHARGLVAFLPHPLEPGNIPELSAAITRLKVNLPSGAQAPEEAAATITATALLGGWDGDQTLVSQVLQYTRPHSRNYWVWFNTALALETYHPQEAYSAVRGASQLLNSKSSPVAALIFALSSRLGYKLNDLDDARHSIEFALSIWPDEISWHLLAAQIYQAAHRQVEQIMHLEHAVKLDPESTHTQLELGKAYLANRNNDPGNLELALLCLEATVRLDPSEVSAWIWLARAQLCARQVEAAVKSVEQVQLLMPDNVDASILRAEIALQQKSYQTAHDFAQSAAQANPEDPQTTLLLAKTLKSLNRSAEALQVVESAIPHSQDSLQLQYERVSLLSELEGPGAALRALTDLVSDHPDDARLLTSVAHSQSDLGDHQAAIQTALAALRAGKDSLETHTLAEVHYLIGTLLRRTGQLDQAIHQLTEAVNQSPGMLDAYLELGLARKERREYQQALSVFEYAVKIAPQDPRPHYMAGLALKEGKDYKRSEIMLRQAAHLAPDDVSIRRQLAQVVALNVVHNLHA